MDKKITQYGAKEFSFMRKLTKNALGYSTGLIAGVALFGGVTFASTGVRSILAEYANIGINVGGRTIHTSAQPFIYNKNVYVPISTIAIGLHATATWNGPKKSVEVGAPFVPQVQTGMLTYYGLPVYSGTHTVTLNQQQDIAAYALAAIANLPFYNDTRTNTVYIGKGPASGLPLSAFYDVHDVGDYARSFNGGIGPIYGWSQGAPQIAGQTYNNLDSLVWGTASSGPSQVPGVTYAMNGNFTSMTGMFGLDDASDGHEAVQLTISGDTGNGTMKTLYQSPWMKRGVAATPVSVDLTGMKLVNVSFSVEALQKNGSAGTVYQAGQTLPSGMITDIDFANVRVH